jgi:F-type H+-transporting ATPase subunit epsilon
LLQQGKIKIKGNVVLEEAHQDRFSKAANGDTVLHINSGTVEMKSNRVVVLAD